MVNASSVLTGVRHTLVDVCFAIRFGKSRNTVARVCGNAVYARGVVLTWIRLAFVDFCATVVSCKASVAEALL